MLKSLLANYPKYPSLSRLVSSVLSAPHESWDYIITIVDVILPTNIESDLLSGFMM